MQMGDGGDQRKTEARPWLRAARFEAHEALDRPRAIGLRNSRAAVGDGNQHAGAVASGFDANVAFRARFGAVLDRVVDEVGECLADQLPIAVNLQRLRRLDRKIHALLLGERLIQFRHAARDLGGVEIRHALARFARLRARDH